MNVNYGVRIISGKRNLDEVQCKYQLQYIFLLYENFVRSLIVLQINIEYRILHFIDIEGAFIKATFSFIVKALTDHGVEEPLIKWIQFMLKHRAVIFSSEDSSVRGYVTKGCPQ